MRERDEARAEVERWKRASKTYWNEGLACEDEGKIKRAIDAGIAFKNGDLNALEVALGIKEKP